MTKSIYAYTFQNKKTKEIARDRPIYWRKEEADNDLDDYELYREFKVVRIKLSLK